MKNFLLRFICLFIPSSKLRHKFKDLFNKEKICDLNLICHRESEMAHKYLDGLNGVEIGGSTQNSFGLERIGGYADIDFTADQGAKWQANTFKPKQVNLVANGDDLPLKDNSVDYVINSHVVEHFFDPVKAIKEWLRVVKPGGYVFMIVPHKERTFDKLRTITPVSELVNRHNGTFKLNNYLFHKTPLRTDDESFLLDDNCLLFDNLDDITPEILSKYTPATTDNHGHWTVWTYESFLELMKEFEFNVIDSADPDDKVGNGFTVVLQKQ